MPRTVVQALQAVVQYKKGRRQMPAALELHNKKSLVTLHATGFSKIAKRIPQICGKAKRKDGVKCVAHVLLPNEFKLN